MPIRLESSARDFDQQFAAFLSTKREASADVEAVVRDIIADVVARGDAALVDLSRRFDRVDLAQTGLRITADEIVAAEKACNPRALEALALARDRIDVGAADEKHYGREAGYKFTDHRIPPSLGRAAALSLTETGTANLSRQ